VRRTHAAKRLIAGLFIGGALTLGFAGAASAQSGGSGGSGGGGSTVPTVTTIAASVTTVRAGGGQLPKTGGELWIPLTAGGAAAGIALATRRVTRRSIV
jgi:hypothetical protein